jgi:predicted ATPase with chaperone activity
VSTVGFPDSTVLESRDLVRATIRNAGLAIPVALITWRTDLRKARISPRAVRG